MTVTRWAGYRRGVPRGEPGGRKPGIRESRTSGPRPARTP